MDKNIHSPQQKKLLRLLRQIRQGKGLRQEDLAALLCKPQSFVSNYERGERRLDLLELRDICSAVGITLAEFVKRFERRRQVKPDRRFLNLPKSFWANVRLISQHVGYTQRTARSARGAKKKTSGPVKVPTLAEVTAALSELELSADHLLDDRTAKPTELGKLLLKYYDFRADVLNNFVRPRLMNKQRARLLFHQLRRKLCPNCPLPLNKQKGEKRTFAFLTGIVNMTIEAHAAGLPCDFDPRELTTITRDRQPFRTLARRVDGAFPGPVDPIAVWEIKEYYYTTTFGSRVADGVYESLLDGMELEELRQEKIDVKHYLMIDDYFTWWDCGRSYLCRIIDMLHMGYVDEVLFGSEVLEQLPSLVQQWVKIARARDRAK